MRVETQIKIRHPLLRYFGGKFRLAPWIISHFPNHEIYVEPFGGAGSVLLQKPQIGCEVYNDLDLDVYNLFAVLRCPDCANLLIEQLQFTPFHREFYLEAYKDNTSNNIQKAVSLLVKSFMSFSSNGCFQKKSGFSSSTQKGKTTDATTWQKLPENIKSIVERLRGVIIENLPASQIINKHDSYKTLFYLDPPYLHNTRKTKKTYKHEMTSNDHEQLLGQLNSIKGSAVISVYDSEMYNDLLAGWEKYSTTTRAASQRGTVVKVECIWVKGATTC